MSQKSESVGIVESAVLNKFRHKIKEAVGAYYSRTYPHGFLGKNRPSPNTRYMLIVAWPREQVSIPPVTSLPKKFQRRPPANL